MTDNGNTALIRPLIAKSKFVGLDDLTHLAAGGESPMLNSHRQAIDQFMTDKSLGEQARALQAEMVELARGKCARLFSVNPEEITFLSNASEGINNVAYGIANIVIRTIGVVLYGPGDFCDLVGFFFSTEHIPDAFDVIFLEVLFHCP